jgi:shikimate kinase
MRVFLIGFMGSGKTHWGKQLAGQMKIPFYDLDEVISTNEKKSVSEIFSTQGEEYCLAVAEHLAFSIISIR